MNEVYCKWSRITQHCLQGCVYIHIQNCSHSTTLLKTYRLPHALILNVVSMSILFTEANFFSVQVGGIIKRCIYIKISFETLNNQYITLHNAISRFISALLFTNETTAIVPTNWLEYTMYCMRVLLQSFILPLVTFKAKYRRRCL